MTTSAVVELIERALNDEAFQDELRKDPDAAISQYDLTDAEIAAIKSGNSEELSYLGLDNRLTKFAGISFF